MGTYSNGQTVALAQVPLAQFASDNLLKRKDGGAFEETLESGEPIYVDAGRNLIGGSLEGSNADIADEFSKMIVTQQAYSANTRIITTAPTDAAGHDQHRPGSGFRPRGMAAASGGSLGRFPPSGMRCRG